MKKRIIVMMSVAAFLLTVANAGAVKRYCAGTAQYRASFRCKHSCRWQEISRSCRSVAGG